MRDFLKFIEAVMEKSHLRHFFALTDFWLGAMFSRPLRPTLRFCFGRVDTLGLWAWSDDLNVILFEFLDDDTTLAQSCRDWLCARRATDRDLESFSVVRMANAWTRARQATDRDLESSSTIEKVNVWICALLTTDRDPASVIPDKKEKICNFHIFADLMFFELISPVTIFCFLSYEMVIEFN